MKSSSGNNTTFGHDLRATRVLVIEEDIEFVRIEPAKRKVRGENLNYNASTTIRQVEYEVD